MESKHQTIGQTYKTNDAGELVCLAHCCEECDPQYNLGGTDDQICGQNMGFPKKIPEHAREECKANGKAECTNLIECSECKTVHTIKMTLTQVGKAQIMRVI